MLNTIQSLVIIAAIVVAGLWTYVLFIRTRQKFPRADVSHLIEHRAISNNSLHVRITIRIANRGDVLLSLVSGQIRLQQILPPPAEVLNVIQQGGDPVGEGDTEIQWPLLHERELIKKGNDIEIEPNEDDEITCDFVIDSNLQTIQVYTYLKNETKRKREIGWSRTTVYDL